MRQLRLMTLPRTMVRSQHYMPLLLVEGLRQHGYELVLPRGTEIPMWVGREQLREMPLDEFIDTEVPAILCLPPWHRKFEPFVRWSRELIKNGQAVAWVMDSYNAKFPPRASYVQRFSREPCEGAKSMPFAVWSRLKGFERPPEDRKGVTCLMPWERRHKWDRVATMENLPRAGVLTGRIRGKWPRFDPAYLQRMAESAATVVLPGHGWDTIRFWEALAVETCIICPSETLSRLALDFRPGEHLLTFNSDEELLEHVRRPWYELAEIGTRGASFAEQRHMDYHRVQPLVDLLKQRPLGRDSGDGAGGHRGAN